MIFKWDGHDVEMSEYGNSKHSKFIETFGIKLLQRIF